MRLARSGLELDGQLDRVQLWAGSPQDDGQEDRDGCSEISGV